MRKDWLHGDRICVLIIGQKWEAPADGQRCSNRGHCHMSRGRVDALVTDGKMEYLKGLRRKSSGAEEEVTVPVARFVTQREWKRVMSDDGLGAVVALQLVP